MDIIKNKNYIIKWRCNWELSLLIHLFGILFCIVMLALIPNNRNYIEIFIVLFFIALCINLIIFVYSFFFGFNKLIFLDSKRVFDGKGYEWRWDEVTQVDIRSIPFRIPMVVIKITTNNEYKKLSFNLSPSRHKKLLEICPNNMVKSQLNTYSKSRKIFILVTG